MDASVPVLLGESVSGLMAREALQLWACCAHVCKTHVPFISRCTEDFETPCCNTHFLHSEKVKAQFLIKCLCLWILKKLY